LIFRQDIFDTKTQEDAEDYQEYLKQEMMEKVMCQHFSGHNFT